MPPYVDSSKSCKPSFAFDSIVFTTSMGNNNSAPKTKKKEEPRPSNGPPNQPSFDQAKPPRELTPLVTQIAETITGIINDCCDIRRGRPPKEIFTALDSHRKHLLQLLENDVIPPESSIMWFLTNATNFSVDVSYVRTNNIVNSSDLKDLVGMAARRIKEANSHSETLLGQEKKVADAWRNVSIKTAPVPKPKQAHSPGGGTKQPSSTAALPSLIDSATMHHSQLHDELSSLARFWEDQARVISGERRVTATEAKEYIERWTQANKVLKTVKDRISFARDGYSVT